MLSVDRETENQIQWRTKMQQLWNVWLDFSILMIELDVANYWNGWNLTWAKVASTWWRNNKTQDDFTCLQNGHCLQWTQKLQPRGQTGHGSKGRRRKCVSWVIPVIILWRWWHFLCQWLDLSRYCLGGTSRRSQDGCSSLWMERRNLGRMPNTLLIQIAIGTNRLKDKRLLIVICISITIRRNTCLLS